LSDFAVGDIASVADQEYAQATGNLGQE